jgi:hypothetical protein
VKDRIALKMVEAAEASGELQPGGVIVEPTSGNTGVGLALVAQRKGYSCIFVCPDKVSEDKRNVLKAYGAEVVVCPTAVAPDHPNSYYSTSDRLVRETPGAWKPDQYSNPNGPLSHYETTGPEMWDDTEGRITHFVTGAGTGICPSTSATATKRLTVARVTIALASSRRRATPRRWRARFSRASRAWDSDSAPYTWPASCADTPANRCWHEATTSSAHSACCRRPPLRRSAATFSSSRRSDSCVSQTMPMP